MENKNLSLEQHSLGGWLPRSIVKQFFNYGETKMCAFARQNQIRITRIGNRLFYNLKDILKILEDNSQLEPFTEA